MDEVTNITELHDKILDYLNEYRKKHPGFKFYLRQNNKNNRLEDGYWFVGDEKYVAVGFYDRRDSMTKTPSIYFGIDLDKYGKTLPHIYIIKKSENDPQFLKFYDTLLNKLGGFEEQNYFNFRRNFASGDIFQSLEEFLSDIKPTIDSLINEFGIESQMLITDQKFDKMVQKVNQVREKPSTDNN